MPMNSNKPIKILLLFHKLLSDCASISLDPLLFFLLSVNCSSLLSVSTSLQKNHVLCANCI